MDSTSINWQELTATAAMCGVFIWGITKGLPKFFDRVTADSSATRAEFTESLTSQREEFTESLSSQRAEFREDLKATREQSRILAQSGHEAVNRVSGSVDQLADKIEQLNSRIPQNG